MNNKHVLAFIMILLLLSYVFTLAFSSVKAEETDVFKFDVVFYGGMHVILETPWYVNSSSSFNISLIIRAETASLENIVINVTDISTFINDEEYHLLSLVIEIERLNMSQQLTRVIPITLPENSSRIVMGKIICSWVVPPKAFNIQHTRFPIAIIADYWQQQAQELKDELDWYKDRCSDLESNLTDLQELYENLTDMYRQLNQTYHDLENEYNRKIGELGATQRLSVIFGVTTALFAFTTAYLFRRKPQVW